VIQLAIDAGGAIHVDGELTNYSALGDALRARMVQGAPAPEMHLRGARGTRYERVTEVMAAAQKAGISKIAFVTEAAAGAAAGDVKKQ
jgi:biopolymer transport protein ExbD